MNQREDAAETEARGPAPSVSTPLLFLVMWTVVAVLSGFSAFIDPTEFAFKPLLIGLIFAPILFGWWFWARHRRHPQLMFIFLLVFVAVQFFFALSQVALSSDDPRHSPIFARLAALAAGVALVGGLIYLWFQMRKGRRN